MRRAEISRKTRETDICLEVNLDGEGKAEIQTGIGFFDHMLDALCRFSLMDLKLKCVGDLAVDGHHTVEDTGICLGKAIRQALGDRAGIRRAGSAYMPMDDALGFCAVDISGRPYVKCDLKIASPMIGQYDTQLTEEFFRAVAVHAGLTIHVQVLTGLNEHHKMEAVYKAFGLALRDAMSYDARVKGVCSTKGALD